MYCRICGSEVLSQRGELEFYAGWRTPIYDCDDCGCLFAQHDAGSYDILYAEKGSCYRRYSLIAESCARHFNKGDIRGLEEALGGESSRYRFVIDQLRSLPKQSRILEIGCSRGHLTS